MQPQGLDAILQALQTGGQPQGNIGDTGTNILAGLGAQQDVTKQLSPEMLATLPPHVLVSLGLTPEQINAITNANGAGTGTATGGPVRGSSPLLQDPIQSPFS